MVCLVACWVVVKPKPKAPWAQATEVDESEQATLLIRAMINAAKSDGRIDSTEQENIIEKLGDISEAEADFIRAEFAAPLDADGFAKSVPNGMEQQIYALSLTSIELDSQAEARYLHQLAEGLNIAPRSLQPDPRTTGCSSDLFVVQVVYNSPGAGALVPQFETN